jgi:hypothetical protein
MQSTGKADNKTVSTDIIIKFVKSYLWELIKFSWLIAILAILLGYYMYQSKKKIPAQYAAFLSFTINEGSGADQSFMQQVLGGGLGFGILDSELGIGKGGGGMAMLQELIKTRKTLELVLFEKVRIPDKNGTEKEDYFIHHYVDLCGYRDKWKKEKNGLADIYFTDDSTHAFNRAQNSLLGFVHGNIVRFDLTDNVSKAGILTLKFKTPNEQLSYNFLRKFYDNLNTYYTTKSIEKQQRIYKAAIDRRDSLEKAMDRAEKEYINYLNTHNLAAMGQHAEQIEIQYLGRKLSGEMEAYFMAIRNVETAKIALEQQTPLLQAIDKPMYPLGKEVPNAFIALIMGLAIGGFLGVFMVLGRKAYIDFIVNKQNPFQPEKKALEQDLSPATGPTP